MKVPGELSAMAPEITVPSAHNAIYVFALPWGVSALRRRLCQPLRAETFSVDRLAA